MIKNKTDRKTEAFKHYLMLGLLFVGLFTVSIFSLELLEGRKVVTTSYVGLNNGGFSVILMLSLLSGFVFFFSIFLPLTFIIAKLLQSLMVKLPIFSAIGCLGGIVVFQTMYGFQSRYLITEYELNSGSSILIFGLAGIIYALVEHHLTKGRRSGEKLA